MEESINIIDNIDKSMEKIQLKNGKFLNYLLTSKENCLKIIISFQKSRENNDLYRHVKSNCYEVLKVFPLKKEIGAILFYSEDDYLYYLNNDFEYIFASKRTKLVNTLLFNDEEISEDLKIFLELCLPVDLKIKND